MTDAACQIQTKQHLWCQLLDPPTSISAVAVAVCVRLCACVCACMSCVCACERTLVYLCECVCEHGSVQEHACVG